MAALTTLFDFPVICNPCADCINELVAAESINASSINASSSFLLCRRSFHRSSRRDHFRAALDNGRGINALMQQSTLFGTQSAVGVGSGIFGGGGESPEETR